ncbi:hypothetical protein [Amycolatopsis speibonae]|uniref:Uncharacterized protein n=1 Tax=Amycolatopsis speibonae TaxID=1450224 RepID=A0ABV7P927_9PSEU
MGTFGLVASPAEAAEIAVPCDAGALVQAVARANASFTPNTLSLAANCVYTLTAVADTAQNAGLPAIRGKLTINGNHATVARAKGAPQFRIISNWGDLTLDKVTITGSSITGNSAGAGGRGGNRVAAKPGGQGGSGGFGGGVDALSGTVLRITGGDVTGNSAGAGGPGGAGGAEGGGAGGGGNGGVGAGVFMSSSQGVLLNPVIVGTPITENLGGRGGDAASRWSTGPR